MKVRRLKKIISFVLSFVMIASICFTVFPQMVEASGEKGSFSLSADKEEVERGEEITVTVRLSQSQDIYGVQSDLLYDTSRLELVSYELGDCAEGDGILFPIIGGNDGKVSASLTGDISKDPIGDGIVMTATFRVKEDAAAGDI